MAGSTGKRLLGLLRSVWLCYAKVDARGEQEGGLLNKTGSGSLSGSDERMQKRAPGSFSGSWRMTLGPSLIGMASQDEARH